MNMNLRLRSEKRAAKRIEEHRINGNLYYIKVSPEGLPPYYLVRETEGGD